MRSHLNQTYNSRPVGVPPSGKCCCVGTKRVHVRLGTLSSWDEGEKLNLPNSIAFSFCLVQYEVGQSLIPKPFNLVQMRALCKPRQKLMQSLTQTQLSKGGRNCKLFMSYIVVSYIAIYTWLSGSELYSHVYMAI